MEPRFIRWMLLLLLLTIVAAEGLRTAVDEDKPLSARVRGGSRFSSRKSGSTTSDTSSEATPDSKNGELKTTTKPSRFLTTRKAPSKRFGGGHTTAASANGGSVPSGSSSTLSVSKSTTEHSLPKSRIEAALQRRAEKLKTNSQKPHPHGLRVPIRKFGQKGQTPEPEKPSANSTESTEEEKDDEDRKYLPDGLSEDAKNAKEEEEVDGIEAPKVSEAPRIGVRGTTRLNDRSKQKTEGNGPTSTTPVDSRSRTGRKIQSQAVLSAKQLKSHVPSSSRFSKIQTSEDSEVEEVTDAVEAGSNRRSFEVAAPYPRKKLADFHKHDIAASGSESVRINIPLNYEESKRLGGSSQDDSSSDSPKRPIISRYKGRSRQTFDDKKSEVETSSTESLPSPTRGLSRRFKTTTKAHVSQAASHESSTEAVTARTRGRHYESKKSNTITESSPSTPKSELRRRNFNQKTTTHRPETSKIPENSKASEIKHHNLESKKPIRSRGRYRVDATSTTTTNPTTTTTTTAASLPSPSPTFFSPTFFHPTITTNFGTITPSFEPEIIMTTAQLPTNPATTTPRPFIQSSVPTVPFNTEITVSDGDVEGATEESAGLRRRASKEDFFNHGLGFRGRRPPIPGASDVPAVITTSTTNAPVTQTTPKPEEIPRGNPGWTLRRRPGHWYDGPPSGPSANPAESPIIGEQDRRTTTTTTTTTAVPNSTPKAGRRGNKTYTKAVGAGGSKDETSSDNENYPPDFKARIAQLQKTGGPPRTQTEEPQLQTSSNVTGSASADLDIAPSDNEYLVVTQTADPISTTTLSLQIPSLLEEQQVRET